MERVRERGWSGRMWSLREVCERMVEGRLYHVSLEYVWLSMVTWEGVSEE